MAGSHSQQARERNNVWMCSFALKGDGQREIVVHWERRMISSSSYRPSYVFSKCKRTKWKFLVGQRNVCGVYSTHQTVQLHCIHSHTDLEDLQLPLNLHLDLDCTL